jgi:four helix bundle protein
MSVRNYSDLIAWQKAMDLVEVIYAATRQFPKEELYGLTSQIRRAAVQSLQTSLKGKAENQSTNSFTISQSLTGH